VRGFGKIRWVAALAVIWGLLSADLAAQDFSGLARIDMQTSQVRDAGQGVQIDLGLSQTVPYRVFTLEDPRRLVLDFREIDWTGVSRDGLLQSTRVSDLRFGALRPGWSRMVLDLTGPFTVQQAGLTTFPDSGRAALRVVLDAASAADFAARSGAPVDPDWDLLAGRVTLPALVPEDGPLTVMIDPGHGGLDPGAEREGLSEAALMLQLGFEVADALNRIEGVRALMTRDTDVFVPLTERMTRARAARADLLISLHADALEEDAAKGASVYTLSEEGEDRAARLMAERHERGDMLAGLDLSGQEDRVAGVLMNLARLENGPQGDRFAEALVAALRDHGARVNTRPRREGRLAVLNAPDFPSVLLEAGFLSNQTDRNLLNSAEGRAPIVAAIVQAVQRWAQDEAARAPLIRQ